MGLPYVLLPSNNLARAATKTIPTNTADGSYPLANLSDGDVTLPFKANATVAVRLVFDCGLPSRVDGMFLPMANIPAGTNGVLWQGHTANSWGAPDVSVPLMIPDFVTLGSGMTPIPESPWANVMDAYSAAGRTKRYWSLLVPSFGSPSDPLSIGELLFGPLTAIWGFTPDQNQEAHEHGAIVKQALMGTRWAYRYAIRQRHRSGTMVVDGTVLTALRALEAEVGGPAGDFIWVEDTDDNLGMLVTFDGPLSSSQIAPAVYGSGSPTTLVSDSAHRVSVAMTEVNRGLP